MGAVRSASGCLICRKRHVKCDESRPQCGACRRREETCEYDNPIRFKEHVVVPGQKRRRSSPQAVGTNNTVEPYSLTFDASPAFSYQSFGDHSPQPSPATSRAGATLAPPEPRVTPSELQVDASAVHSQSPEAWSRTPTIDYEFSYSDAKYVHHFASQLGRWLDCTDPQRQFSLKIPQLVRRERILLLAVTCFAARHMKDTPKAVLAYEESVNLLIPRLNAANVASDDALLCAIVILRVYEQLDVSDAGIDYERHLTGASALLRSSQGLQVDPTVPTLRHAAFWVYARQAMYNACVYQQPPDVDPETDVRPVDMTEGSSSFIQDLGQEGAWTNHLVWLTIKAMHFCFRSGKQEIHERLSEWQRLSADLDQWQSQRPSSFEPIWVGQADSEAGSPFPVVLLATDWHVMAYVFYQLSRILLIAYQPKPRFAIRRQGLPDEKDGQEILKHALLMCGACQSMSAVVPSLITLCQTCFIWGPLMTDQSQRDALLRLLNKIEAEHAWPTLWIVDALRREWQHEDTFSPP